MYSKHEVGRPSRQPHSRQRTGWKTHLAHTHRLDGTVTLGAAPPSLARAEQRLEEFLATLAHELRSPLASMQMAMELFETLLPDDPKLHELMQMTRRQLRHLTRLVDELGDASSITAGKLVLDIERLDLRDVVGLALELAAPLMAERRHSIATVLPSVPVMLHGDATRLTQLVANLLANAAKFTPHGGRIELRLEAQGREAAITVTDNGIGIEAEMLSRLFDRFVQAQVRGDGSMGLGLPLVRRIAELHGGTVAARSDGVGTGSEFTVRLPLHASLKPSPAGRDVDTEKAEDMTNV